MLPFLAQSSVVCSKFGPLLVFYSPVLRITRPNHGPDGAIDPRFASTAHIFYASGTVSVKDGLPKFETKGGPDGVLLPDDYHDGRAASAPGL